MQIAVVNIVFTLTLWFFMALTIGGAAFALNDGPPIEVPVLRNIFFSFVMAFGLSTISGYIINSSEVSFPKWAIIFHLGLAGLAITFGLISRLIEFISL